MLVKNILVSLLCCSALLIFSCSRNPADSPLFEDLEPVAIDSKPSKTVEEFWSLAINGDFKNASEKITAAPVSYLYWKPGQKNINSEKADNIKNISADNGDKDIGGANPELPDADFANQLKERINVIHETQMNLNSIESEIIEADKAEVKVKLQKSGWTSFYEQRVLLRKINNEWKIIAIWDWIN